jgi:2-polyprenyl-3-methyl-5-hydroxy-6-metoxy-1,4-benzoquinol methylase
VSEAFLARVAQDLAAAHSAALVVIGDRLGLYRALAEGPATSAELARRTSTHERYVREWLLNQVASGYALADGDTYALSDEQAQVLAAEGGPAFAVPAFQLAAGLAGAIDAVVEAFRTGSGVEPGAFPPDVREGIARGSSALVGPRLGRWVPQDVSARLAAGGAAADLGCGSGGVVLMLAQAFPAARILGLDVDEPALERARADAAPLGERVAFRRGSAPDLWGEWDLVTCIDTLHDLPDPEAAARAVRGVLARDACFLVVEPCVTGRPDAFARLLSAVSSLYCVPVGRAGGGEGRGSLGDAGELLRLVGAAGFGRVRVVERLPLHVVVEARP